MNKRLYTCWSDMNHRCRATKGYLAERYHNRGIRVCKEWQSYKAFERWAMSSGYADDLTIDRIDNDGNYEPSNCRWATRKEQSRNRSDNRIVTVKGKRVVLQDAIDAGRISGNTARTRIRRGMSPDEAVTKVARPRRSSAEVSRIRRADGVSRKLVTHRLRKGWDPSEAGSPKIGAGQQTAKLITFNGETHSITDWAKKLGLNRTTIGKRLSTWGWSVERALTTGRTHK